VSELRDAHKEFGEILADLGVEVGGEVLDVWSDRVAHGYEPLPYTALTRLALWTAKMRDAALRSGLGAGRG
jgi:hypothetical protein